MLYRGNVAFPESLTIVDYSLTISKLGIEELLIDHQGYNRLLKRFNNDTCIDRKQFVKYLYKFFEILNYDENKEVIIIIGSKTSIGRWLTHHFIQEKHFILFLIKGFFDLDFSNPMTKILLSKLEIKRIYICYSPDFESFSTYKDMKILNGNFFSAINDFALPRAIGVIFFSFAPFWREKHGCFINNRYSTIFLLPYLVTTNEISLTNYLDQKLLRVYLNRSKYQTKFSGYDDYYISYIRLNKLLPDLIDYKFDKRFVVVETPNMIKLSKFISMTFNENENYNYDYVYNIEDKFKYQYQEEKKSINLKFNENFVKRMNIYHQYISKYCYLSIVVVSRNDNYGKDMRNRLFNYMKSLSDGMDMFPSAKVDFVIVDYYSPSGIPLLTDLTVPYPLITVTSTIIITKEQHFSIENFTGAKLDFNEFAGKNIALRYSKSEFTLNTNLDLYFPPMLMEVFSLEHFNKNILYYTSRQDQSKSITYGSEEYYENFKKVESKFINTKRMFYHSLEKQDNINGPGDFQLASNDFIKMLGGYPQYYFNWGIDWVWIYQSSRLLTQGITFDLAVPVFHQYHPEHVRTRTSIHEEVMKELICKGYCSRFNYSYHNDPRYFGFHWLSFNKTDRHYLT